MTEQRAIHLSIRSDHSIGESTFQVDSIVERAKALGYDVLALTDKMSVSSLASFSKACKKADIKPIVGCSVRVYRDPTYRKPPKSSGEKAIPNPFFDLKVYVKSDRGLQSLMNLLTLGNSSEYFYYHARVGLEDILFLEDVIVTTGDLFNLFSYPLYEEVIERMKMAGLEVFVELPLVNTPLFDRTNALALAAAQRHGLAVIPSQPVFYDEEGADTADVLRAISTKIDIGKPTLPIPTNRDWHLKNPKDLSDEFDAMIRRVDDTIFVSALWAQARQSLARIADACTYEFKKLPPSLPKMADDEFHALVEACKTGWHSRFANHVFGDKPDESLKPEYKSRLIYELGIIKKLGFSNYFLLVQDIVRWSKENEVIVGPGRGSVGGSLIAYLMGITDVDPIRFGLIFERFINPDRIDLPDADLDFMSSRRHMVIDYIVGKYGKEHVAGISNYATLGPASALRDVSRMHGLSPLEYACSKQIEKEHGVSLSLEESVKTVPDIARFKAGYPNIWKHATALEGCIRNLGQHAAGVIVAAEPISKRAVLLNKEDAQIPVVNWDKEIVEDFGLIKMDILGLTTLDVIKAATEYIDSRHGVKVNILDIPLDDANVLKAFGEGDTVGVFQFEGGGMRKLLKDLAVAQALTFEDLAAATALFRPGPIDAGLVDRFVQVKQGVAEPEYDHALVEPALKETYGVITYQEQVMQVCRDLCGFSLTEADHVRKAMGKKDKVKMAEYREKFVAGAAKSGMREIDAEALWDKIEGFAGYAFNKSHSVEYSIISYITMWLKVNYPVEFYAAAMSTVEKEEKLTSLVLDARNRGITVMPPDLNISSDKIEIASEKLIYAPFQAVKGISTNVSRHIIETREEFKSAHGRGFESVEEFEEALSKRGVKGKVNSRARASLEAVGAFASITTGAPAPMATERLKDRINLMPGFTVDAVKATRGMNDDRLSKIKIAEVLGEVNRCDKCSLKGKPHASPRMGKGLKFMMVFDSPTYGEGQAGKLLEGDAGAAVKMALRDVGLSVSDGYFTSLVRSPKPKEAKSLTNEQIIGCSQYLAREIEALKPQVIIAMGSNAVRYFAPGVKGTPAELAGKVIYREDLGASVIFGINPGSIFFDASKVVLVQDSVRKLSELVA
ncbi:DNA polymerase III subunit alpha [Methyloversatilis sp.]|uniref:DNA polymerase III subunit alpha n=1 Tax=Methyloversatilis sp. TaxID=2569862 RepID=UPI0035AFECD2